MSDLKSVDFEIFGKVQKVFFRKHTRIQAQKLGLQGFVQNTDRGSVIGTLQGNGADVDRMKGWLKTTGSPKSRIDKATFSDEKTIKSYSYNGFNHIIGPPSQINILKYFAGEINNNIFEHLVIELYNYVNMNGLKSIRFEVFGKVQGVSFRRYTEKEAIKLNLRGFVQNTPNGTVVGAVQGIASDVEKMKKWLQTTGSPSSTIDRVIFSDEKPIQEYGYNNFSIIQ